MINLILRIAKCLDKNSIYKIIKIQIISFLIAILNVLSALIAGSFVLILSGERTALNNKFFEKTINLFITFDQQNLIFYISTALVSIYILSVLFQLFLNYFNLKWTQDINIFFQSNLYTYFIEKDWLYHSSHSSKNLISKLHTDTQRLTNTITIPFLELVSNLFLSSIIIFAIFVVDYKIASISIITFTLIYIFFYYFFKKKLRNTGDIITKIYPRYFRSIYEGFSTIKDVILFNKKKFYKNLFINSVIQLRNTNITQVYLLQIPRSLIEIIFFIFLIFFIIIFIKFYKYGFAEICAVASFFGICAIKIIPALQKIFKSISSINSNLSAFESIEQDLLNANKQLALINNRIKEKNISFKKKIELKNVTFTYPGNNKPTIINANMTIPYGSKIGLVGKTGSGKSTLIDLILGFLTADKGELNVDNVQISKKNLRLWQNNLSYVPQNFYIYEGSIKSNIAFALNKNLIDKKNILNSLKISELKEFIKKENLQVGEFGNKLSGGQKQRLGIARAIYKNSEIVILDEATSSLDTLTEKSIFKNLNRNKKIKTMIIVSHRFETLKFCDKFYFVNKGKVIKLKNFSELLSKFNKNKNFLRFSRK